MRRAVMPLFQRWFSTCWTSCRTFGSLRSVDKTTHPLIQCGCQNITSTKRFLSTVSGDTGATHASRKHPVGVGVPYSAAELETARQAYIAGKSIDEIADLVRTEHRAHPHVPGLLYAAIGPRRQAKSLIMPTPSQERRKWTKADDDALLELMGRGSMSDRQIARQLERSHTSVASRARRLLHGDERKVYASNSAWSTHDLELLRKLASEGQKVSEIARVLGRSYQTAKTRLQQLGITARLEREAWTKEQKEDLQRLFYAGLQDAAIGKQLTPPRTAHAVSQKRTKLGLTVNKPQYRIRAWSAADDDKARELYGTGIKVSAICKLLPIPRSASATRTRISFLGLAQPKSPAWSKSDDALLRELSSLQGLSDMAIGSKLSPPRTSKAVYNRRSSLGLRKRSANRSTAPKSWSLSDDADLIRLTKLGLKYEDISERMSRSISSLENRTRRLGLLKTADRDGAETLAKSDGPPEIV